MPTQARFLHDRLVQHFPAATFHVEDGETKTVIPMVDEGPARVAYFDDRVTVYRYFGGTTPIAAGTATLGEDDAKEAIKIISFFLHAATLEEIGTYIDHGLS